MKRKSTASRDPVLLPEAEQSLLHLADLSADEIAHLKSGGRVSELFQMRGTRYCPGEAARLLSAVTQLREKFNS